MRTKLQTVVRWALLCVASLTGGTMLAATCTGGVKALYSIVAGKPMGAPASWEGTENIPDPGDPYDADWSPRD